MTHRFVSLSLLGLLPMALLAGCPTTPSTDDTGTLMFPDCDAIIAACHDVAPEGATGPAADCHETAHDAASNAECAPVRAICVSICEAIDGGVVHDEDAHSHDEDAPAEDAPAHDDDAHSHDEDAGTAG